MPTLLQTGFRLFFITLFSVICTYFTMLWMIFEWWRNRNTFFMFVNRQKPLVLDSKEWTHRYVKLSKYQMHYVETGNPSNKEKIVFLHGFPEFWYSWRYQLIHFGKKFHCIALDLRGYNESDKPDEVNDYKLDLLVEDVRELIELKLGGKAVLVGHDWGGAIAWTLATRYSNLLEKLIILNAPNPSVWMKLIRTRSAQLLKSWYMFMFQAPYVPEFCFFARDYNWLEELFRGENTGLIHPEHFTDRDMEVWKYVFSRPGALTPPINFYRAALRGAITSHLPLIEPIRIKTQIIWGEKDHYLLNENADYSAALCTDVELHKIEDAGHWIQQDTPDKVNQLMGQFLIEPITGNDK